MILKSGIPEVIDLPDGSKGIRETITIEYTLDEWLNRAGAVYRFAMTMRQGIIPPELPPAGVCLNVQKITPQTGIKSE
jgi:hypothetical protein